jgi:hypothetical protein
MPFGGGEELPGLVGGEGVEAAGAGCAGSDVVGDVVGNLLFADGVLQRGLEYGVDVGEREWGEPLAAALADRAAARVAAGLGVGMTSGVDPARAALADGPQFVQPGADVLGGELGELLPAQARYQVLVHDGGVAGVGGLAELVDGDVLQPVRQEGGEAALRGDDGDTAVAGRDLLGQLGEGLRPCWP